MTMLSASYTVIITSICASWIVIGLGYTINHICRYPICCCNHPEVIQTMNNDTKGRIPIPTHFHHIFCRYLCYSLSFLFSIPCFFIMLTIWFIGRCYYLFACCYQINPKPTNENNQTPTNSTNHKTIAVIGAGPSGIVTAKYLLEYGHKVIIFEKLNQIGGAFHWSYQGLLTTSNFITQFSDLEIDTSDLNDASNHIKESRIKLGTFLTFKEYCNYLIRYAKTFKVFECIHFNEAVIAMNYNQQTKHWSLQTECNETYTFDSVAVCAGIACQPNLPENLIDVYNKTSDSNIQVMHSRYFIDENNPLIQNKNVLLIGCGESGSDIALMVSKVCSKYNTKCYLSTRNGPGYLIPRFFGGMPSDMDTSRMYHTVREWGSSLPIRFKRWVENFWLTPYDDIKVLREAGKINKTLNCAPFQRYGTKSLNFIRGMIHYGLENKPDIKHIDFENKIIQFEDESEMKQCDVIICCTGYKTELDFFNEKIQICELFEKMFDLKYGKSLCFIGLNRPFIGSLPPISEMSARYYSLIVSEIKQLPSQIMMLKSIALENKLQKHQFPNINMPALCDFITKYDSLSKLIDSEHNTVDNMFKLFVFHPFIWYNVLTKTIQTASFKIYGPNKYNDMKKLHKVLSKPPSIPFPIVVIEFAVYVVYCLYSKHE